MGCYRRRFNQKALLFFRSTGDDNTSNVYSSDSGVHCGYWRGSASRLFRQGQAPGRSARSSTGSTPSPYGASGRRTPTDSSTHPGTSRYACTRTGSRCSSRSDGG